MRTLSSKEIREQVPQKVAQIKDRLSKIFELESRIESDRQSVTIEVTDLDPPEPKRKPSEKLSRFVAKAPKLYEPKSGEVEMRPSRLDEESVPVENEVMF